MPLAVGDRLGAYEVLALIGQGGMGEVYRARDTKLARDVAIKVLSAMFASDPDRMGRFEREARVLASLNHSNIATLYGLEESGGVRALVMELVEGPTLANRIADGAIPLEEAIPIALQIIEALDYAHDRGVIHRDLKPANVKLTPEGSGHKVKLLDFGLARAMTDEPASPPSANSPTLTLGHTQAGVILGTAAYMSPEQVKGKRADRRADIWAFGVVLYEMLTGKRPFEGETTADILSSVMKDQPLLDGVPVRVRPLIARCLEKDPRQRLQSIGEARIALEKPIIAETVGTGVPARAGVPALQWALIGVLAIVAAVVSFLHFREQAPVAEVMRFEIPAPEKAPFGIAPPVLSPDGRKLAFVSSTAPSQLWVRCLDTLEARALPGTESAVGALFWSPESRSIAYWSPQPPRLKRVDVSGGPPQTVCETPQSPPTGAWSPEGVIVFHGQGQSLVRAPAAGGECTPLTKLDTSRGETSHGFPSFLPDGRHFVYFRQSSKPENNGIYIGSLDTKPEQQSTKQLMASESGAIYVPSADPRLGHLLFIREGTLMARPFEPERLELAGDAVPVAEHVAMPIAAVGAYFSASTTGALAYRSGAAAGVGNLLRLTWLDRQGKVIGATVENMTSGGNTTSLSFSPDGSQAAFTRADRVGGNQDIWMYKFAGGTLTRFTFDPATDTLPVWSPDGKQIVFASDRGGGILNLYRKAANNAGTEELLFKSSEPKIPTDWSRDGRFLLFTTVDPKTGSDLWFLSMTGAAASSKPEVYLRTQFAERDARFSPDGRFVAYGSDASGTPEVYVQPFPNPEGEKWMVSRAGGTRPVWRRDGKELFYLGPGNNRLFSVEVALSPVFKAGVPKGLFGLLPGPLGYDVSADGQKFLKMAVPADTPDASSITIVLNWQAGLKK